MADVVINLGKGVNLNALKAEIHAAVEGAVRGQMDAAYRVAYAKVPVRKVFAGGRRKLRFATVAETEEANAMHASLAAKAGRQYNPLVAKPANIQVNPSSRAGKAYYRVVADAPTRYNKYGDPIARARTGRNKAQDFDPRTGQGRNNRRVDYGFFPSRNDPSKRVQRYGIVDEQGNYDAETESRLTRQGFAELVGRAAGVHEISGKHYIGGRLKHELYAEKPVAVGSEIKGSLVSPTHYARYVELGTRHAAAQPYLRPALAAIHGSYRQAIIKAINRVGTRRISYRDVSTHKGSITSGFKEDKALVSGFLDKFVSGRNAK